MVKRYLSHQGHHYVVRLLVHLVKTPNRLRLGLESMETGSLGRLRGSCGFLPNIAQARGQAMVEPLLLVAVVVE